MLSHFLLTRVALVAFVTVATLSSALGDITPMKKIFKSICKNGNKSCPVGQYPAGCGCCPPKDAFAIRLFCAEKNDELHVAITHFSNLAVHLPTSKDLSKDTYSSIKDAKPISDGSAWLITCANDSSFTLVIADGKDHDMLNGCVTDVPKGMIIADVNGVVVAKANGVVVAKAEVKDVTQTDGKDTTKVDGKDAAKAEVKGVPKAEGDAVS